MIRFKKKAKLSSRFIRPFEMLFNVGVVYYALAFPPSLSIVNPCFHGSMLCNFLKDESHGHSLDTVELGINFGI